MKALFVFLSFIATASAQEPMPSERVQAVYNDERFQKTVELLSSGFGTSCPLVSVNDVEADVKCSGGGDMGSCYYTFHFACDKNDVGLAGFMVRVEFVNINPNPLNLSITAQFLQ